MRTCGITVVSGHMYMVVQLMGGCF